MFQILRSTKTLSFVKIKAKKEIDWRRDPNQ